MIIHTVLTGETLSSIAAMYGKTVQELIADNGMPNPDRIVVGQSIVITEQGPKLGRISTNGYAYTFIDRNILDATLPYLTYLSVFNYGITADGSLIEPDDSELIAAARSTGTVPLMVLTALDANGNFSGDTAAAVMQSETVRTAAIENIARKLDEKGYGGVDLDFEYIPSAFADYYTEFTRLLKQRIAPKLVFVALAPKTYAAQPGLLYEAHDYGGQGAVADRVLLMTYEWGYAYGPPQAVAPLENVIRVVDYAVTEINPQKIFLGYPNYGYDWTLPYRKGNRAVTIGNEQALSIAASYNSVIEFNDTAASPYFYYVDHDGASHVVWFEDARSTDAKLRLVADRGLYGMGVWNIMRYYAQLWTVMTQLFDIEKQQLQ